MLVRIVFVVLMVSSIGLWFGILVMVYMCKLVVKDRNECGEGWGYLLLVEEGGREILDLFS